MIKRPYDADSPTLPQTVADRIDAPYEYEHLRRRVELPRVSYALALDLRRHAPTLAIIPGDAVRPVSPYTMIQEMVGGDPWRVLVGTILQNRTHRRVAHPTTWALLERYRDAPNLAAADVDEVATLIAPCGLQNVRAPSLVKMSREYVSGLRPPWRMSGIGAYGKDSWAVFVEGRLDLEPWDPELQRYLIWARRVSK